MFDFLSIRKTIKDFGTELKTIDGELETLRRQREDVIYSIAPLDDVLAGIESWAATNAAKYGDYLRETLMILARQPTKLSDPERVREVIVMRELLPTPTHYLPISADIQLCGLIGPQAVVELIRKQAEATSWPTSGLPIAEREKAVAELDKKIDKLQSRRATLINSAADAGLTVS